MIRVTVPATSANLGAGFDSMGVALSLYNTVLFEQSDRIEIISRGAAAVPTDENNLIYRCARRVYEICGRKLSGIKIVENPVIPIARGLGSSSACIVAGLMGANELLGRPLPKDEIIDLAAVIEGHPDNVAPAVQGGFVAAVLEDGHVWNAGIPVAHELEFCAFVPDFELRTDRARAVLPATVSRRDAVYNLSRAALFAASLASGRWENLPVATKDALHQPYRLDMIPGARHIMREAAAQGALGTYVSGAGPTVVAIIRTGDEDFYVRARETCAQSLPGWQVMPLLCDRQGAVVTRDVEAAEDR